MSNAQIINWELCKERAAGKAHIAHELLSLFIRQLPDDQKQLRQTLEAKDTVTLADLIHKMHGATCYLGLPNLKDALYDFETIYKDGNDFDTVADAYEVVDKAIIAVLRYYDAREFTLYG